MMNKSFSVLSFGILLLLVLTSFASAALTLSSSSLTFTNVNNVQSLTINGTAGEIVSLPTSIGTDVATLSYFSDVGAATPITSPLTLTTGTATIYVKAVPGKYFALGGKGTISDTTTASTNTSFSVDFNGNLDIKVDDLSVTQGFGPDDTEWYPLDNIKAQIYVENTNPSGSDNKIKNIIVEWMFYDTTSGKVIMSGKETKFSLDGGDDKTVTINFQLDKLSKLKDVQGDDFQFYAWATGEDYHITGEPETSGYDSKEITLDIDDNFVVLNNIQTTATASCGTDVQITADVANIGGDDQSNVYVVIYNKDLGINKKVQIGDIDSMEDSKLETTITIPEDATEKTYSLTFSVYNEDDDIYTNDNDDEAEFSSILNVEGSCSLLPQASVSADLTSTASEGKEFEVKAIITNTGSKTSTFNLALNGYSDWASLVGMDKSSVTLASGASQEVSIKLQPSQGISGDQTFVLDVKEGSKTLSQPIVASIDKASIFSGITGFFANVGGNNTYLWGIVALNVILILVIIVVAVRVIKKK